MRGLYVITDENLTPRDKIFEMVESSLRGGAKFVQLRDKEVSYSDSLAVAIELKKLLSHYDAKLVINDNLELALESKADGLHIGKDDLTLKDAKVKFKNGFIGVSCYGDILRAVTMQENGADYIAFGSFYSSPTKPHSGVVPKETITIAKERLKVPICVIGGINLQRAEELINLGADMVAVISDIWSSDDIQAHAKEYSKLFV